LEGDPAAQTSISSEPIASKGHNLGHLDGPQFSGLPYLAVVVDFMATVEKACTTLQ
jgi:hypothetical protein